MTAAAPKLEAKPSQRPPNEEGVIILRLGFKGNICLQNDYGAMTDVTDALRVEKNWAMRYYPRAGVYRVWNARCAQKGAAVVTTIWRENVLYHLAADDTEGP